MLERLLENWLDSASERSYQAPFCQMLSADGHRVVHSTRHHPIEFGKDVITVAPDGVPCAYQLKGNPGGRLTLSQFREIQGQLWQLTTQAINFPGVPKAIHRSYLVTNGYVEEDVQKSIAEMNAQWAMGAPPHPTLELITKGDLLAMSTRLGLRLWPTEVEDLNGLIEMLAYDGRELLPHPLMHKLLARGLCLEEGSKADSKEDIRRRITSAALLVATAITPFSRQENHYAVVAAWAQYASYVTAACARHGLIDESGKPAITIAIGAIVDSLCLLCDEALERENLVEGDAFTDVIAYTWRRRLLRGLMSLLWFWTRSQEDRDSRRRLLAIDQFLSTSPQPEEVWGEAMIPLLLAEIWRDRALDEARALASVSELLHFVCQACLGLGGKAPLPSPYYAFDEVARHNAREFLKPSDDALEGESFRTTSFYALPLLQMLAARGLKGVCASAWPDMTRINHKRFIPEQRWQYGLWRTQSGIEETVQLPKTQQWDTLFSEAKSVECSEAPGLLLTQPLLLMLLVILFPYRGTPNVIRHLDRTIGA